MGTKCKINILKKSYLLGQDRNNLGLSIMQNFKQRRFRAKTLDQKTKSQHVIPKSIIQNQNPKRVFKTISYKTINGDKQNSKQQRLRQFRSQTTGMYNKSTQVPYQKFVKQLSIVLPTPKQKFYQFMQIAPFNRTSHHLELIQHFLKQYKFLKNHPTDVLSQIAKKVKISQIHQINQNFLLIVQNNQCIYQKQRFIRGDILGRKQLKINDISCSPQTRFITINRHQYKFLVACYLDQQKQKFKSFLSSVQIFKMFPKKAFDKFIQNLSLSFYCAGQYLYKFGDDATQLHIVYKGKASRKVIVEVDKMNRIPMLKYSKVVKILSKSYQHKIQFEAEDLVGIAEVIDHIQTRKQNIKIEQNSIILGLDKIIFQQNLDEYIIDRLKKYNMKKYPVTYDKLCEKFQKDQILLKQQEMRKIDALRSTITSGISQKKSEKINSIIKKYQQNIKKSQLMNLLDCKIQQRKVQRQ